MKKYCVSEKFSIKELIDEFEYNNERVMIVINNNEKVIGLVSSGDILRAISIGIDISANITNIINKSFLYLHHIDMEEAFKIFAERKITLLPVVDKKFRLVNVITLDDIYSYLRKEN